MPTVIAGDSLSLECKMDSSPVKPKVTWIPPENSDCHQSNHFSKKIKVKDVSRCHSGVWTCKLEYGSKKKYYTNATTTVSVIGEIIVLLNSFTLSFSQCIYPFT